MSMIALLGSTWVLAAGLMGILWWRQCRTENANAVDVAWAAATGSAAVGIALLADGDPARRLLVAALGGAWGLRLAWHIHGRVRGAPEDGRYASLRRHWRGSQGRFFLLFQGQGLGVALFALPFAVVATAPHPAPVAALAAGVALWVLSVGGETVADRQLALWKADPAKRGRTYRSGLWQYSRHPNYFFEWLHWFTYPLLAWGAPGWWVTLAVPLVMVWLLLRVTGIPHAERQALASRGEDYRAYQRVTPKFLPWFPRGQSQ